MATLPLFITPSNRTSVGLGVLVIGVALYLLSNHLYFYEPRLLPMSWVDLNMPFLPNTFWIYNSEYVFFLAIFVLSDATELNKLVYAFLALLVVSVAIFWVWPTVYPRNAYALPDDLNAVTKFAFARFREVDTPANCCPSLHVSGVYLCAFAFSRAKRSTFLFFLAWGTLIAISTLTTKQHYLVDVISGFVLAVTFHYLFHRVIRYQAASAVLSK